MAAKTKPTAVSPAVANKANKATANKANKATANKATANKATATATATENTPTLPVITHIPWPTITREDTEGNKETVTYAPLNAILGNYAHVLHLLYILIQNCNEVIRFDRATADATADKPNKLVAPEFRIVEAKTYKSKGVLAIVVDAFRNMSELTLGVKWSAKDVEDFFSAATSGSSYPDILSILAGLLKNDTLRLYRTFNLPWRYNKATGVCKEGSFMPLFVEAWNKAKGDPTKASTTIGHDDWGDVIISALDAEMVATRLIEKEGNLFGLVPVVNSVKGSRGRSKTVLVVKGSDKLASGIEDLQALIEAQIADMESATVEPDPANATG
jgi:hypothetical protein